MAKAQPKILVIRCGRHSLYLVMLGYSRQALLPKPHDDETKSSDIDKRYEPEGRPRPPCPRSPSEPIKSAIKSASQSAIRARMAAMCSGVDPQQAPITLMPSSCISTENFAISSGVPS